MIKQRQLQTNQWPVWLEEGLDLRTAQPYLLCFPPKHHKTDAQGSVVQPLGRLATMVENFVADANNATAQNWADARAIAMFRIATVHSFQPVLGTCNFGHWTVPGRNTYRSFRELRKISVEENAISA